MTYLDFNISSQIKKLVPEVRLGIVTAAVNVIKETRGLNNTISDRLVSLKSKLEIAKESEIPTVAQTRSAYKLAGKEPSRYRPSAEALLRRLRTGKDLYRINNVVDVINILSMSSGFSIGGFDFSKIEGGVTLDIGDSASYQAIGRGPLNIQHMPGLRDDLGFFGTPTSDSERTMVTSQTSNLVLVYYDFGGNELLDEALEDAMNLLKDHCGGSAVECRIV